MKLKYRGVAYQPGCLGEQGEDPAQLGLTRRQSAQENTAAKPNLRKPGQEMIYRGVRYTR